MLQYRKGSKIPTDGLIIIMLAMVTVAIVTIVIGNGINNIVEGVIQSIMK